MDTWSFLSGEGDFSSRRLFEVPQHRRWAGFGVSEGGGPGHPAQALGQVWALAQEVQTENMTVVEGGVAEINCRLHRYDGSIVVIQNPARQTLFFNGTRGEGKLGGGSVHVCVVGLLGCWDARPLGSLYSRPRLVPADSPTARIQPSQAVLREGDTLLLTCVVNGNPLPTEITWSRANDSLPERAQIEGAELTLPALSPGDNGTYACHAANKHGRASDQYVLVVYGKEPRRPPTDLQPPPH
nr:cell adhesion molecule 4-like [Chelonoidis abingdonii]